MKSIALQSGIIYGPVRSRRLRWSLGLNASPINYKLCSFNCVYCQYGHANLCTIDTANRLDDLPTLSDFARALETALRESEEINNITFSGNGEPTLHPQFEELVDIAKQLRNRYFPKAKLGILSNSSMVHVKKVDRALANLDFRIMKLDAGAPETFKKLNRPCKEVNFSTMLSGLQSLENVTLQTMFVDGKIQNVGDQEVREWIERVSEIKPVNAQIYSLHRPPAESFLHEVPPERLQEIAARTKEVTGIPIEVIVAASPYRRKKRRYWK